LHPGRARRGRDAEQGQRVTKRSQLSDHRGGKGERANNGETAHFRICSRNDPHGRALCANVANASQGFIPGERRIPMILVYLQLLAGWGCLHNRSSNPIAGLVAPPGRRGDVTRVVGEPEQPFRSRAPALSRKNQARLKHKSSRGLSLPATIASRSLDRCRTRVRESFLRRLSQHGQEKP
jgi:hypothetical protein